MARPLRIEFPGALYHVAARGIRNKTSCEGGWLLKTSPITS